ncbi:MAG: metallophosphoesterase family protein [Desulfosudaceae bacterium]
MKIYAAADIHGRSENFDLVRAKAVETKADAIVLAGDIGGFFSQNRSAVQLAEMPLPVLVIRGNSDRARTEAKLWPGPSVHPLHLRKVRLKAGCFSGISGTCLLPLASRLGVAEAAFVQKHLSFFQDVSVLVTHPPPRGVLDKVAGRFSAGSSALRRLVLTQQPPVLICGHIHENAGTAYLGSTLVVNCSIGKAGGGALVSFPRGGRPSAVMLER